MKLRFFRAWVSALFVGVSMMALSTPSWGEEAGQCREGEWVLSVSTIPALREKAVDALQDATSLPLQVAEESAHVMKVKEKSGKRKARKSRRHQLRDEAIDPCASLKREIRAEQKRNRESGKNSIVRRYECSCNGIFTASMVPNDPYYYLEWGLNQSNNIDMDLPEAWNLSTGSKMLVAAVIDSGVDQGHQDLGTSWTNYGENLTPNGIDDDNNGYIDDIHGFNAINNSGNSADDHGHGTHVAGTIAATIGNSVGTSGVANVRILPVKFLNSQGSGSLYDAVKAVDYVTDMAARAKAAGWEQQIVLSNNSWGGGGYYQALYDAIARARNGGVLFVAAAGNNSNNNDANPSYPAGYELDNVISVAAIDRDGNLASFSNYGATSVDIAGPGVSIASTYPGNQYVYMSGTSMATPNVSGALMLLRSYSKGLSYLGLKQLLYTTGKSLATLNGVTATGKLASAYGMLSAAPRNEEQVDWEPGHQYPSPGMTPTPTRTPTPTPTATPAPTPTIYPPGNFSVSGKIVLPDGGVAGGVKVSLSSGSNVYERFAASGGEFAFTTVPSGQYTLTADSRGWNFPSQTVYLTSNVTGISLQGTLTGATVSILIIDQDEHPLPGVTIQFRNSTVITNSQGRATSTEAFGDSYTISASKAGYVFDQGIQTGTVYGDIARVAVGKRLE